MSPCRRSSTCPSTTCSLRDAPRRSLHVADAALAARLADLAEDDRASLLHMLDALVTKNRLKALAGKRG